MSGAGIDDILDFWFGPLDAEGCADTGHSARWWRKDAALDEEIRRRFGEVHRAVRARELDSWLTEPRGRLAQVIVLDQFSRNMFRGTPAAFASDPRALQIALDAIERGDHRALPLDQRTFLFMPLMHSEDLAQQDRMLGLFSELRDQAPPAVRERFAGFVKFAEMHRDIVRRFGRFPHRNAILDRPSTPEEIAFLEQPDSSF
ncbi:MAG TPA: DUF924 family protein [Kofleriaceae bacterium]|nr:DUF924 family protein [Kofleriaceae bacterium]